MEDFKDVKSGYSITFVSLFLLPYFVLEKMIFEVQLFLLFWYVKALYIACWQVICAIWVYTSVINFDCFICQNFKSNPYFEDTKLTKTFTFLDEGTTKVTATSIKWKEGMVRDWGLFVRVFLCIIFLSVVYTDCF